MISMLVSFASIRLFALIHLFSLPLVASLSLMPSAAAQEAMPENNSANSDNSANSQQSNPTTNPLGFSPNSENPTRPQNLRPLAQETSVLSLVGGNRLMAEAKSAIAEENYALAAEKLQQARQIFNQLSNFHQQLSSTFSGLDNKVAEWHRYQAVETAQKRDEATYELALIHRRQNEPELSVPLLIQVIQSQGIGRELGAQADQLLLELGFGPRTSEANSDPETIPPLARENSLLGIEAGKRLLEKAREAIAQENYAGAIEQLQQTRGMLNQLSNFSEQLAAAFSGIDNDKSDFYRDRAVETAQMRDEATYQLALVHRADNKPELAIPLLIQIIRSQQPTRELGQQAYQQLYELGFVDAPYSNNASESTPGNFSSNP